MPDTTLFNYERGPLITARCFVTVSLIGAAKLIIKWNLIKNALASGSDEEHMRHAEGKTDKVRMALC